MSLQYSPRLKEVINKSKLIAKENKRNIVNPMDLFLSCINSGFDRIIMFLEHNVADYADFIQLCMEKCDSIKKDSNKKISWSKESILCIDSSINEANLTNSSFVGVEHLFSSLLKHSSQVRRFLKYLDIDHKEFYRSFQKDEPIEVYAGPKEMKENNGGSEIIENVWERISDTNFKFYGRNEELEKMMSILCRKKKSNILLLGEPGVGKTALVEGLVHAMNRHPKDSNIAFIKMNVFELNISSLISDTIFRGQFEKKLNGVIDYVKNADGKGVLFIDEFHMAMKAGDTHEGSVNLVNILKPSLANGDLSLIGATTFSEFKKYIETDPALVRRFEIINLSEPSKEETFNIVWNCKNSYEEYHGFEYNKSFIKSIIDTADKYLPYKKFPDKAFEMLDDISSREKLAACKRPDSLIRIENYLINATELLDKLDLQNEESDSIVSDYEFKLEEYKGEMANYIKSISQNLKINKNCIDKYVQEKFNASTISPDIKDRLKDSVYGQDKAIESAFKSIFIHSSITRKDKPLNSMLFFGKNAVGKKLLSKKLAELLGYEKSNLHIDMSRYNQHDSIYYFTGQNKNDINGHNTLFEFVKRNPSSFVIFENIDKCSLAILDIIAQILENGKISDQYGKEIDFSRAIIVCTTSSVKEKASVGFGESEKDISIDKSKISDRVLSLFDDCIAFEDIGANEISRISKDIISNIKLSHDIEFCDSVVDYLSTESLKSDKPALEINKIVKSRFVSPLFDFIFNSSKSLKKNSKISAKMLDNSISFSII
jgi:ATP-dependent Clp protease ATP-binding subunit ClpA